MSFGNYLLSDARKERYQALDEAMKEEGYNILPAEERLKEVDTADFSNWLHDIGKS